MQADTLLKKTHITLITGGDPISRLIINSLLCREHVIIDKIILTRIDVRSKIKLLKSALKRRGIVYFLYAAIEPLLISLFYRDSYLGQNNDVYRCLIKKAPTVMALDEEAASIVPKTSQFVISIRPGLIFKNCFIDKSPMTLNVHCSDLPNYRGIAGIARALADGKRSLGVSLHTIENSEIDSGTILRKSFVNVRHGQSILDVTHRCYIEAAEVLLQFMRYGSAPETVKSDVDVSEFNGENGYMSWPSCSVFSRARFHGHKIIRSYW